MGAMSVHSHDQRRLKLKLLALLFGALTLASACAELERPAAYAPAPTPSVAIGEGQVSDEAAGETFSAETVDDFVPSTSIDYTPLLLVPTDNGVVEAGPGSSAATEGLVDRRPVSVYDDLVGGLVVEESTVGVTYLPAQGEPQLIDESGSALLDVGYWDGAPRAFLQVDGRRIDRVQLVAEQAGDERERREHIQLADDETLVDFSASRGIQALIVQDAECGDLRFYGADGNPLDIASPPLPECTFPGRPSFGAVAISRDGEAVAYTTVTYRGDGTEAGTDLVVRELASSQPFFPYRIGENLDRITSITFDGSRIAYAKESAGGSTVTIIDVTGTDERPVNTLGGTLLGTVSFARNPILLGSE